LYGPDVVCSHAGDGDALQPAAFAADDLDVAFGDAEGGGEEGDDGVVGGAFDRRRGDSQQQRAVPGSGAAGLASARDDADVDFDARAGLTNQETP
jgi:hypothetical protein